VLVGHHRLPPCAHPRTSTHGRRSFTSQLDRISTSLLSQVCDRPSARTDVSRRHHRSPVVPRHVRPPGTWRRSTVGRPPGSPSEVERAALLGDHLVMACRMTELVVDARDPDRLAQFWCQVLGWQVTSRSDYEVEIAPDPPAGPTLVFLR